MIDFKKAINSDSLDTIGSKQVKSEKTPKELFLKKRKNKVITKASMYKMFGLQDSPLLKDYRQAYRCNEAIIKDPNTGKITVYYCKKRCFQILIETAKIALKGRDIKFSYIGDDMTRQLMEVDGDQFAEEEYGLVVSNDDEINQLQQKLDGMVQMGLQNQMLSFSTAIKIYNSPSVREIQRLIEKDETQMKESQAKAGEDQQKQQQAMMQQQALEAQQAANLDLEKFNREDETKRYIVELQEETKRLQAESAERGVENDNDDFDKFEKELGIKQQALSNDMQKHNDNMSMKDKEIAIKNKIANKPKTNNN